MAGGGDGSVLGDIAGERAGRECTGLEEGQARERTEPGGGGARL